MATNPKTMGLAGVAQVVRIERDTQFLHRDQVTGESHDVRFAVTTYWTDEADPERLMQVARDHWSIENGQHYRRDATQREDHCPVRHTQTGRNLSLFRSLAIFLCLQQTHRRGVKRSLPDFQKHVHRHPSGLIGRFTQRRHEE